MTGWTAPRAHGPLRATVALPGSKSLTNRLLVVAAAADGPTRLVAPLRARDTELMAGALRALGAEVVHDGADWLVTPAPLRAARIDAGLAGTVMRFVPPLAALADGAVDFDGDVYARERPMATLIDGLRQAGVDVDDGGRGALPFTVHGRGCATGGHVSIDASASSQFVSGLLLTGARFDKGIEITHRGTAPVPSRPHLDMTLAVLRDAGADAGRVDGSWYVRPGRLRGGTHVVEPDLSNAAPFLAAAALAGGTVTVPHWPVHTTQPGDQLRELLAAMGADVGGVDGELSVTGTGTLHAVDADLRDVTEVVPVLAVLAAFADGPSHLRGLAHMRGHETDRLAALAAELGNAGVDVGVEPDGLRIAPAGRTELRGGPWRTYADHRMATAGALLGLVVDGVVLDDISATTKTLPDFSGLWSSMLAG